MRDSELADPYVTPRTLPAHRSLKVLAFVIILAVVSLSASATAFMFYRAASSSMQLDRVADRKLPFRSRRRFLINTTTLFGCIKHHVAAKESIVQGTAGWAENGDRIDEQEDFIHWTEDAGN